MTEQGDGVDWVAATERRASESGRDLYGQQWVLSRRSHASGRIELVGNHLDYNGGPVLAAAIDRQTTVLAGAGDPTRVEIIFADRGSMVETIDVAETADWRSPGGAIRPLDYARGVLAALDARGIALHSTTRMVVAGDVPFGLGVSSSAALTVALTLALAAERPDDMTTVLVAQEAEHRAGTPCGTMDQSASVAGGVILYDGATSAVQRLTPELGEFTFLLADSGVDRSLAASVYPDRVRESADALTQVNALLKTNHRYLAAVSVSAFETVERSGALPPVLLSRLAHIVSETARVSMATKSLRGGDWLEFGRLMTESGRSSASDYDVSHPRVEELVALLLRQPGVAGARMMGGGGGGSVLALVRNRDVEAIATTLGDAYHGPHGLRDRPDRVLACRFGPAADVTG